jgi:hypothetical protein
MTSLFLADSTFAVRATMARAGARPRLLVLADGDDAQAARAAALALGAEELPRGELVVARRDAFRQDYLAFMAAVNEANQSPFWWAMPFTTKNPLSTPLCRQVFACLLVAGAVDDDPRPLIVVTDDAGVAGQLRAWARAHGRPVTGDVRPRGAWWRRAARRALPGLLALTAAPLLRRWWQARGLRDTIGRERRTVLVSLVHAHSFTGEGAYRDAYFGALPTWLAGQGERGVLFPLLIERPGERLLPRLVAAELPWPVLPIEGALSLGDLLRCLAHAAGRWIRPFAVRGDTVIGGVDVRRLLERAAAAACRDGAFLDHVRLYYAGRALARHTGATRWVYPYENRAFEKMLLTGVREAEPAARLTGYNHASITLAHTNFVLEGGEPKITPLPDTILTLGTVVRDWLDAHGHYPPGVLRVACALRQALPSGERAARRQPVRELLLTLATSVTEYVRTLRLLEAALRDTPYRLRVRPHPTIALETALRHAALPRTDFFSVDAAPLGASLAAADAVLYASSTVGLEAVARGIPALYLDIEDVLETDPMLGWSRFRWSARRPADVRAALEEIERLDELEYASRQEEGVRYARRYLIPVSDDGMRPFLAA